MATQTITKPLFGATGHTTKANAPYLSSVVIDFAATTHTSSDVFEAIHIPANTMVLAAGIDVLTLDAGTGKVDLVDSLNSITYVAALVITSAGQLAASDATAEMFVAYDSADTLDVTVSVAVFTTGVIRPWAVLMDMTNPIETQRVTFA